MAESVQRENKGSTALVADHDFHQNRYAALLDETIRLGDRWLDLGAGTQVHGGWVGPSQQSIVERAGFLAGCDLVQDHLVRNPFLAARVLAFGEQLPFADNTLDLVSANMVVEHVANPTAFFAEVHRVLRPGGRFVFVTPNRTHPVVLAASLGLPSMARRLLAFTIEKRELEHVFRTFYRCNTLAAVRRVAQSSGLQVQRLEAFSSFPFARRPGVLQSVEGAVLSLARQERFAALRSNLLACLERPAPAAAGPKR